MAAENGQFQGAVPILQKQAPQPRLVKLDVILHEYVEERPKPVYTGTLVWTVTAFQAINPSTGSTMDSVTVEVKADNEEGAVFRAMDIVKRPHYRIHGVREEY